jgi:antitoxin CptB
MDKPTAALDPEARRLLWRCRRGMKELDVLLERFARGELPSASLEQRRVFARFLELPDPVLVDYLLGQTIPPEPELAQLARRITAVPANAGVPTPASTVTQSSPP